MTSCKQQIYEKIFGNLHLEKLEREFNNLNKNHLNDQKVIHQISNQIVELLKDKESLIQHNMSMISELNDIKSKETKVERKYRLTLCFHEFKLSCLFMV